MSTQEQNLEKLSKVIDLIGEDTASSDEVVQVFEAIVTIIGQLKTSLEKNISQNKDEFDTSLNDISLELSNIESRLQKEVDKMGSKVAGDNLSIQKQLLQEVKRVESLIPQLPDLSDIRNQLIEVEKKLSEPIKQISPQEVRDLLELLPSGEKLSIQAIEDLPEILEELKNRSKKTVASGGFNYGSLDIHIVDDETPVNTGDDLSFTIKSVPSPVTSLKVYRGGARQRITEDYTFSGNTITFTIPVSAGEIILCDYRV